MGLRHLLLVGVLALALGAGSARAETTPSLAGETLDGQIVYSNVSCQPSGTSTMSFSLSGTASGPYPGSFTLAGTVVIGPQVNSPPDHHPPSQFPQVYGDVTSLDATFSISSGVTGSIHRWAEDRLQATGSCTEPAEVGPGRVGRFLEADAMGWYQATITTSAGAVHDEGAGDLGYSGDVLLADGSASPGPRPAEYAFRVSGGVGAGPTPQPDSPLVCDSHGCTSPGEAAAAGSGSSGSGSSSAGGGSGSSSSGSGSGSSSSGSGSGSSSSGDGGAASGGSGSSSGENGSTSSGTTVSPAAPPQGKPAVGATLSAPAALTSQAAKVQWQACSHGSCRNIPGATGSMLKLTPALAGEEVRVVVTTASGTRRASRPTRPVRKR